MLKIALPNKGRLAEETRGLFEDAGLEVRVQGERALTASLGGEFQALFVRAQDIPEFVADGAADAGVTGLDLVSESERDLETLLDLEFGRCRLVVAAREGSGIAAIEDLQGTPRVATVFPRITRRWFAELGRAVEIVPMSGSAEIAPHLGIADVIVDLTSTGSTLRVNGLVEVATVMRSTARLIAAPGRSRPADEGNAGAGLPATEDGMSAARDVAIAAGRGARAAGEGAGTRAAVGLLAPGARATALDELVAALGSVLRARGKRYLMANVPRAALERVKSVLPGLNGPTVVDVLNGDAIVAVHAVVEAASIYRTIAKLKALGGEGILVTRIERLMP
jgi:ATP phosphoribosyltransferase